MKSWLIRRVSALGLAGFATLAAAEQQVILVGGYVYPPYVSVDDQEGFTGATPALLQRLNEIQDRYSFQFSPFNPATRHEAYEHGRFDAIFFESPHWGWDGQDIEFTAPIARDRDIYLARQVPGRDQAFFADVADRTLLIIEGYHYGFADYETDRQALESTFNVSFAPDQRTGLRMLVRERGDILVLNESYLRARRAGGDAPGGLLTSEKTDSEYDLAVGLSPASGLSANWLMSQLEHLRGNGSLARLEQRWGVTFAEF